MEKNHPGSVAVPAGRAAVELPGGGVCDFGVEVPLCCLPSRQRSAGAPGPPRAAPAQDPAAQPGESLPLPVLAQPFPAGPGSPEFHFLAEMSPVRVCRGVCARGRCHPGAFGGVWGYWCGSAGCGATVPRRGGKRLWQTANVEHKSWWRQGRSEEGGRTSKALRSMRLRP